jgi:VWFA-related protein
MSPIYIALLISLVAVPTLQLSAQSDAAPPPDATTQTSPAQTPATAPPTSDEITTLHATARLVVLDVVVVDGDGHPVHGLKPSDFALTEDGVPQGLASFKESGVTDIPAPEETARPNTFSSHSPPGEDVTKTVIVLGNLDRPDGALVRPDLEQFLKGMSPGAPIAIFRIDWQGLHMVQDFSSDPKVLAEAGSSERLMPPLGFQVTYPRRRGSPVQWVASYVSAVPGRVNLVWIAPGTGEFSNEYPDLAEVMRDLKGSTNVLHLTRVVLYPINPHGYMDGPFANTDLMDLATKYGGHAFLDGIVHPLSEIVATGNDYYKISYSPTNPVWDGAYRKIHIDVSGIPQMTKSAANYWSRFLGWSEDDERKVVYRQGYFARTEGLNRVSSVPTIQAGNSSPSQPDRRLISYSPKGDPRVPGYTQRTPAQIAMDFGAVTPSEFPIKVTVTPSPEVKRAKLGAAAREGEVLAPQFRELPYRSCRVHYWVDPASLHFEQSAPGSFHATLEFASIVYRDDGVLVSLVDAADGLDVDGAGMARLMQTGVTFDQTIAMPIAGNPLPGQFFLRAGVHDHMTGQVSAVMIPSEEIKLLSPQREILTTGLAATH